MSALRRSLVEALALVALLGVGVVLLAGPLGQLGDGVWGPATPWANGDFIGNYWCFWRTAELFSTGRDWMASLGWPDGSGPIAASFPNLVDAWMAAPFFDLARVDALWNAEAVGHLLLAVLATYTLCRAAGGHPLPSAAATTLLLASPTLLHELAGGRMATFAIWPGIFALAAFKGSFTGTPGTRLPGLLLSALAGALLALQLYVYAFHAFACGVLMLVVLFEASFSADAAGRPWARVGGAATALLIVSVPYLIFLRDAGDFVGLPPPAGHTALPIAGLVGLGLVPERCRVVPVILPILVAGLLVRRTRAWSLGALALLVVALGPAPTWKMDGPLLTSPWALITTLLPPLSRMHHPIRVAPFALAAVAVVLARLASPSALAGTPRTPRPGSRLLRVLLQLSAWTAALLSAGVVGRATSWASPAVPPGASAAAWIATHLPEDAAIIDVLGDAHDAALSLQPWHRRPLLQTTRGNRLAPGRSPSAGTLRDDRSTLRERRFALANALGDGRAPSTGDLAFLRAEGFRAFLVVARPTAADPAAARIRVEAALDDCCGPASYSDSEASLFEIPPQVEPAPER